MRRLVVAFLFPLLAISLCVGQAANSESKSDASNDPAIRGAFPTTLMKSIDSKKLKDGDVIVCQTLGPLRSSGGLMIPSEAKVIGHVTEAKARSKGDSESSLAIVFDKIEVTKGKELPMKGVLQAVAPGLGSREPNTGTGDTSSNMGKAGSGANMPPPAATVGTTANNSPKISHPVLNSQSQGVLGFKNLQMGDNAVLSSDGKEVKLDAGTQMLIRAEIPIPVQ
jgi:hypothetical protein